MVQVYAKCNRCDPGTSNVPKVAQNGSEDAQNAPTYGGAPDFYQHMYGSCIYMGAVEPHAPTYGGGPHFRIVRIGDYA